MCTNNNENSVWQLRKIPVHDDFNFVNTEYVYNTNMNWFYCFNLLYIILCTIVVDGRY